MDDAEVMTAAWIEILKNSMLRWSQVDGAYLELELVESEYQVDPTQSTNVHLIQVLGGEYRYAGSAHPVVDPTDPTKIIDCDIVISGDPSNPVAAGQLELAVTHELGHCLGLGHPHSSSHAIMSYHRTGYLPYGMLTSDWQLSVSDRAGAIYLYPEPGLESKQWSACGSLGGSLSPYHHEMLMANSGLPVRYGFLLIMVWIWLFLLPLVSLLISGTRGVNSSHVVGVRHKNFRRRLRALKNKGRRSLVF